MTKMGTNSKTEAGAYWLSCKLLAISCIILDFVQLFIFQLYLTVGDQLIQGNTSLTEQVSLPPLPDVKKALHELADLHNWTCFNLICQVVVIAFVALFSIGILLLSSSLQKDASLKKWMLGTRVWMILKVVYVILTTAIGLLPPLLFYIPASLILYTLAINIAALAMMAVYRRQIMQLVEIEIFTDLGKILTDENLDV